MRTFYVECCLCFIFYLLSGHKNVDLFSVSNQQVASVPGSSNTAGTQGMLKNGFIESCHGKKLPRMTAAL